MGAEPYLSCADRHPYVQGLNQVHGERRAAIATTERQHLLEVWLNRETGTFTITLTHPDYAESICLLMAGESWEDDRGESR